MEINMRLLKLLVVVALCITIPLVAFAHPGRTDSDGGHHDRETGEYHYHHGYEAHMHADVDGNGTLDCPYRIGKIEKPTEEADSPRQETDSTKNPKRNLSSNVVVLIICGVVFGFGFIVDGIKCVIDKIKQKRNK
jgi:hypothetical protein